MCDRRYDTGRVVRLPEAIGHLFRVVHGNCFFSDGSSWIDGGLHCFQYRRVRLDRWRWRSDFNKTCVNVSECGAAKARERRTEGKGGFSNAHSSCPELAASHGAEPRPGTQVLIVRCGHFSTAYYAWGLLARCYSCYTPVSFQVGQSPGARWKCLQLDSSSLNDLTCSPPPSDARRVQRGPQDITRGVPTVNSTLHPGLAYQPKLRNEFSYISLFLWLLASR